MGRFTLKSTLIASVKKNIKDVDKQEFPQGDSLRTFSTVATFRQSMCPRVCLLHAHRFLDNVNACVPYLYCLPGPLEYLSLCPCNKYCQK